MRICVVSQEYPPGYVGGIGTQSRVKAQGLAQLGHEVEILTAGDEDGPPLRSWDDGQVCVREMRIPGGDFEVYNTETYWLGYTWSVLGALRALAAERPYELIDFPEYAAEGFAYQLDREEDDSTAVVVHLHGSLRMFAERIGWPEPGEPLHEVGTFMEATSIRAADGLLAASTSIAQFTAECLDISAGAIEVVEGAVDTSAFTPSRPGARSDDEVRLLFVGSIAANKGVQTVWEAFLALAPEHPRLTLTIAGEGDEEIAEHITARAAQHGVSHRVRMLGFVEHAELPELYRSVDVVAAPSQFEGGLGMVYLEAMASGLPVIATAAGGAVDAVADGETGVLLERGSAEETTSALRALVNDRALRERMGEAARRRAERFFAPGPYAERVLACYERAIQRRQATVTTW
jgi:glycosyltransferase involved in cell wall biosynthesis